MKPQFLYEFKVPLNCLQYWINKNSIFGLLVCKKVGVGAALRLKQLFYKNAQDDRERQMFVSRHFFTDSFTHVVAGIISECKQQM